MTEYYNVNYENEASGPFVAEGANLTWSGGVGFVVSVFDDGTTGKLKVALVSGPAPADADALTQGSVTADTVGDADLMQYPAYMRDDYTVPSSGIMVWAGPALSSTHSFFFDGQTGDVAAADTLTFSGGQTCEVITVEADNGVDGELSVRFTSSVDLGLPADNDTFDNGGSGDGAVNGTMHDRAYTPLHLHRLLSDLNDNEDIYGNDDLSRIDPVPSGKDTNKIVNLLSNMVIDETIAQHMYDGSISQAGGGTLFSGLNMQVTTPNAATQPILIQDDAIVTDYWKNAFMPHSIDGNIRILKMTRDDGVDIDGKRVKGKLAEFGDTVFEGGTTLSTGTTALALFASTDGNNTTDVGTVAGAPYNTAVLTEGLATIDYNNGNGATEYYLKYGFGSANSLQAYERTKYIQRRGSSETLFGRNAQLFTGVNKNFLYDTESGNLTAAELMYWGTEVTYSGQTTNMTIGEVVTFSPSGAKGRLLYDNDAGATGTLIVDLDGSTIPTGTDTMAGATGDGDVDSVSANTNSGSALLLGLRDDGTDGVLYLQGLTGLDPADGQLLYGGTSNETVAVNAAITNRTINNQFIGVYTGANYQTNFGIGLDNADAIVGDLLLNLANVKQTPPNNQTGKVTKLQIGDTVTIYPWDGAATDVNGNALPTFAEALLTAALVAATSTEVVVDAIPDNTPASGFLRIERDSDNNYDLIEYASYTGLTYTLVGTAPSAAGIGNNTMRAFYDGEITAGTEASYTAVKGAGDTDVAIVVKNGYSADKNGPIKPFPATATFGSTGFEVGSVRNSDA